MANERLTESEEDELDALMDKLDDGEELDDAEHTRLKELQAKEGSGDGAGNGDGDKDKDEEKSMDITAGELIEGIAEKSTLGIVDAVSKMLAEHESGIQAILKSHADEAKATVAEIQKSVAESLESMKADVEIVKSYVETKAKTTPAPSGQPGSPDTVPIDKSANPDPDPNSSVASVETYVKAQGLFDKAVAMGKQEQRLWDVGEKIDMRTFDPVADMQYLNQLVGQA